MEEKKRRGKKQWRGREGAERRKCNDPNVKESERRSVLKI